MKQTTHTQSGAPGFSSFRAVMDLALGFVDTLFDC